MISDSIEIEDKCIFSVRFRDLFDFNSFRYDSIELFVLCSNCFDYILNLWIFFQCYSVHCLWNRSFSTSRVINLFNLSCWSSCCCCFNSSGIFSLSCCFWFLFRSRNLSSNFINNGNLFSLLILNSRNLSNFSGSMQD